MLKKRRCHPGSSFYKGKVINPSCLLRCLLHVPILSRPILPLGSKLPDHCLLTCLPCVSAASSLSHCLVPSWAKSSHLLSLFCPLGASLPVPHGLSLTVHSVASALETSL